eukprot:6924777-Prymnesium_polylepis.1
MARRARVPGTVGHDDGTHTVLRGRGLARDTHLRQPPREGRTVSSVRDVLHYGPGGGVAGAVGLVRGRGATSRCRARVCTCCTVAGVGGVAVCCASYLLLYPGGHVGTFTFTLKQLDTRTCRSPGWVRSVEK